MQKIARLTLGLLFLALLAACAQLPINEQQPTSTPTTVAVLLPTSTPTETVPQNPNTPQTLRIWLPPEFDPNAETAAGEILRERLATFESRRPDLTLEIRIKASEGATNLLDALRTTQKAAPDILPDLVALSRPDLEAAAQEGILHPIDGLSELLNDPDWYPYVRPLARIQNSIYGFPFSANLFGLVYRRNEKFEDAPELPTLESLNDQGSQILFPADSAAADLSFCLYSTYHIPLLNEQGQPTLDNEALTNVLTFYQSASIAAKSGNYQTYDALWDNFLIQPQLAFTGWTNDYLQKVPGDAEIVPIPAPNGESCALATAWSWALAGSSTELQPAAVELAEYLSDSAFLAEWTAALGTLPTRPTAIAEDQSAFQALSLVAQPIPPNDIAALLSEKFRAATMSVLQDQVDPSAAAAEALSGLQ